MGLSSSNLLRKECTTTPSLEKTMSPRPEPLPLQRLQSRSQTNNGWQQGAPQDSPAAFPAPPPICKVESWVYNHPVAFLGPAAMPHLSIGGSTLPDVAGWPLKQGFPE